MKWGDIQLLSTAEVGRLAERLAAAFLTTRGAHILTANLTVAGGELDLIARIGGRRTAIEVRSIRRPNGSSIVAIDAFDDAKATQVRRLAAKAGCQQVDLVSVCFAERGIDIHWVPGVS